MHYILHTKMLTTSCYLWLWGLSKRLALRHHLKPILHGFEMGWSSIPVLWVTSLCKLSAGQSLL